MHEEWTLLKRLIWLYFTKIKGGGGGDDPTSNLVGTGQVDYMILKT